jgi:hypothetical protein
MLIAFQGIAVASEKPSASGAEVMIAEAVAQASAPRFSRALPRWQSSRHASRRVSPSLE